MKLIVFAFIFYWNPNTHVEFIFEAEQCLQEEVEEQALPLLMNSATELYNTCRNRMKEWVNGTCMKKQTAVITYFCEFCQD